MVDSHRSRFEFVRTVGEHRPAVSYTLALLVFAGFAVAWAFQLMDAASQTGSITGRELVVRRVADFLSQASGVAAPSANRQALLVLVGTIVVISIASVTTVAYLNIALVRARKLLKNQKSDLSSLEVVKDRFLNSVTHELNTPITVAIALTDSLARNRDRNLTKRQLEQLTVVRSSNRRISDIVDAMIRTSATEIRRGLKIETVRYSEFLESALESIRNDIALQGVQIESTAFPAGPNVGIDLDRVSQVMTNLLVNAAHNSPEGSVITVSVERLEGAVKTNVRDSGSGISALDSEHVFSPFYRADTENTRRLRGLGLTMVHRIVELHGGQVGFEPNFNDAGVTFWFTLPTAE